ncbi:MAG: pyruvate kinase [Ilumatobacteraceae bacterium]
MESRTKIVATIGPASDDPEVLSHLLAAGTSMIRINLSHGSPEEHLERLDRIRSTAAELGRVVAVLADLPGPKVRAGSFGDEGTELENGAQVRLVPGNDHSDADVIQVDYPTLIEDLDTGDHVVLGDGGIRLHVTHVGEGACHAIVLAGGPVRGRPGVHIPSERLRLATPTERDLELAKIFADAGVDFLAVSFVRTGADLDEVRRVVGSTGPALVAKIETRPAIDNMPGILKAADAVMVARGDLGIELPLEELPHLQKRIIRQCVEAGVPVITATQMLESMTTAPSPTRAEVTDVANAVFDGTDAVMLSGETAIGADPALVVRTMSRIAARAEAEASYTHWGERLGRTQLADQSVGPDPTTMALTHAAFRAASDIGISAILCCTRSGRTVRAMARFRPTCQLVGLSPDARTVRQMAISWGVQPMEVDTYHATDELVWFAVERAVQATHIRPGEQVIVLAGAPDRPSGAATDVLRVVTVE